MSNAIWRRQFGADPNAIGRSIRLDGDPYTIIGVMPRFVIPATPWGAMSRSRRRRGGSLHPSPTLRVEGVQTTLTGNVRPLLGAEARDILRLVLVPGLRLTVVGTAVGVAAALAASRLSSTLIFGVSSSDLATYVTVPILLALVALAACFVPAYRATRVSPIEALRS